MQDAESVDTLLENLFKNGYAGGLFWQYQPDAGDPWMKGFVTASPSLAKLARAHVDVKFDGQSDGKLSVVASSTAGGKVTASPVGRVDTGTTVTITAAPDAGYEFTGWSGDTTAAASVNPITVKAIKDRSILANFRPAAGTNLLKNGDFASTANWQLNVSTQGKAVATVSYAAGQADINITAADTANWYVQLMQGGFPLQAGGTYVVSFDAWANAPRAVQVGLTTSDWNWQDGKNVSVTASKATYQVELAALKTLADGTTGVIQFNIGEVVSTLHIDNVILVAKGASPVLGRDANLSSPRIRLGASRRGLSWSAGKALAKAGNLVVTDLRGEEVGRFRLAAGASQGTVAAHLPQGLLLARIEGAGATLFLSE
jgi:uncharacterized repeat protein (TIGR02543 family)